MNMAEEEIPFCACCICTCECILLNATNISKKVINILKKIRLLFGYETVNKIFAVLYPTYQIRVIMNPQTTSVLSERMHKESFFSNSLCICQDFLEDPFIFFLM